MRDSAEVIQEHTKEDGEVDLRAVIAELQQGMQGKFGVITPQDFLVLQEYHLEWALMYIGRLVLQVAAEVGALAKSFDTEVETLKLALTFDKTRRLYEAVRASRAKKLDI